tara:strand:- start:13192 stop:20409 length:7218 start_codon:yes stop_codon:yes gene_type:complete
MAEITNNFLQGKMNKDLDERILPKGQYRDAMNIQITTSDGSDVGSAQSILGTKALSAIGAFNSTSVCIGSIEDVLTGCIYYFVRSSTRDFIAKYDIKADYATFIAVDISRKPNLVDGDGNPLTLDPFLNFTGRQITAINIIDNYLFWTDGDNEPKKIDLSKNYSGDQNEPQSNAVHSRFYLDGVSYGYLKEEHLTVIKKKPLRAPQIKVISSKGNEKASIFERQIPRFCIRYKYEDNQLSAFSPFTQPVFNAEYIDDYNSYSFYDTSESYNTAMLNYIRSIEVYGFVDDSMPDDVVEVEILYKTEDSNVIYSIAKIKKTDPSWSAIGSYISDLGFNEPGGYLDTSGSYTIRSENVFTAIAEEQFLRPFDNVPRKALAQEVVGNRIVYGNYTQNYDLDSVNIDAIAWPYFYEKQDRPVRSLKSDRSYQVGVLFGDTYGRETPIFTSTRGGFNTLQNYPSEVSWKASIKINSDIPSWAHYYKFYIKESSGQYYNLLNQRVYVPFAHSQFENEEDHVYLSFPSKDRSKISVDDYIVLKTVLLEPTPFRVSEDNKYKVLDVSNEAPEAISYKFYDLGSVTNNASNAFTVATDGIFTADVSNGSLQRIDQQTDTIIINKTAWQAIDTDGAALTNSEGGGTESSNKVENLYISWSLGGLQSKRYKVTNVRVSTDAEYIIRLSETIQLQDALIANKDGLANDGALATPENMPDKLNFKIQRKDKYSDENFSGHFFVKIAADDLIKTQLINEPSQIEASDKILHAEKVYLWLDQADASASATKNSNVQYYDKITDNYYNGDAATPNDIHEQGSLTNTKISWDALLDEALGFGGGKGKFFIDGMYMAASNPSDTLYARESGQGWAGSPIIRYPKLVWAAATPNMQASVANSGINYNNTNLVSYSTSSNIAASNIAETANWGWMLENYTDFDTATGADMNNDGVADFYISHDYDTTAMDGSTNIAFAVDADDEVDWYVNGIEPIIQADLNYYVDPTSGVQSGNGGRAWSNSTIYGSDRINDLASDYDLGGYYMHVSFLGPGVDLFTRADSYNPTIPFTGPNCLAKYLQGIWGGGAFNHGTGTGFVEMETHWYDASQGGTAGHYLAPAPGVEVFSSNGNVQYSFLRGYDPDYQTQHERQFDPTYGAEDAQAIQEMVSNLVAGKKFRFSEDTNEEIYTILGVKVKYVYNHTPWRMRKAWDAGTSTYVNGGDSVEEAVIAWAEAGTATSNSQFTSVLDKLEAFGARSNRRIVYALKLDKNPQAGGAETFKPLSQDNTDFDVNSSNSLFEFVAESAKSFSSDATTNKALFETEPEKSADLDIYYEISDAIPVEITEENKDIMFPVGSKVEVLNFDKAADGIQLPKERYIRQAYWNTSTEDLSIVVNGLNDEDRGFNYYDPSDGTTELDYEGKILAITRADGSVVHVEITEANATTDYYIAGGGSGNYGYRRGFKVKLSPSLPYYSNFYNVFAFGNGIESNTVRDDFNGVSIRTGARASTTLDEPYREEVREHGLIFSGLYNSNTGVNNLNQFIQAQKITKDLNPTYGSIQKLFQRQTNLVVFCEDRVVKVLSNKDAVFNADGNPQLVANERVLGQVTPFVGEFGISKNPESFASESYRAYFTDKQRRAVLRLSMDGLTPISDAGMKDWFGDNLADDNVMCLGTYDEDKQEYNLTIREGYTENLIANDSFDDGVELVETLLGEELLNNAFTGGADFTEVDIAATNFYQTTNRVRNADLTGTINHINVTPANDDIIAGNWYMVEVDASNLPNTSDFAIIVANALAGHPEIHGGNQNTFDFRETLPYHFGQVSGSGTTATGLKLLPANRYWDDSDTPILLGIWRAPADSSTFELNSWVDSADSTNPGFTLDTVTLYNITEIPSMSEPNQWEIKDENYTMPHAAYKYIEEFYSEDEYTATERARPMVYFKNNAAQFNTENPEYFVSSFYNGNNAGSTGAPPAAFDPDADYLQPTYGGYNLSFTVGDNVDTGSISGTLQVRIEVPTDSGPAGFIANITEAGDYVINYNTTSDYTPTIVSQPDSSSIGAEDPAATASAYFLRFAQTGSNTFEGSVSNISIKDATSLFTGGGADSWTFESENNSNENEPNDVYWDSGSLVFDNINPTSTSAVYARQNLGNLRTGSRYNLSFDYSNGSAGTSFCRIYYFNSQGKGFHYRTLYPTQAQTGVSHFNEYFTIDDTFTAVTGQGVSVYYNTLVFYFGAFSSHNDGASLTIDNISMIPVVDEDFKPKTLSYSEQAKGWISFKSFIPESGVSLGGDYYTFNNGAIHKHHEEETNNNVFYDQARVNSFIDFIFNDSTPVVKDFKTLSYEGSAGKRNGYVEHAGGATDVNYDNLNSSDGWFVSNIVTDLQKGSIPEFIKKESKYYNYIRGGSFDNTNSDDIGSLNVQGLGVIADVEYDQIIVDEE